MKHRRIISFLSAALLGFSAAAFPPDALKPVEIVAEAATITKTSGDWKYSYESGLSTITIVKYLGTSKTPEIPEIIGSRTVTKIADHAFMTDKSETRHKPMNITKVTIPGTVVEIGEFAFSGSSLTNIVIPDSVKKIRRGAFANCNSLKTAEIKGKATLYEKAFADCTALKEVTLNENCKAARCEINPNCTDIMVVAGREGGVFERCSALAKINGEVPWSKKSNGEPVFSSKAKIKKILTNVILPSDSDGIKFVKEYCTALCDYIVKTETKDWMGDAVKARQLHDWLVRHVKYEDEEGTETKHDVENHNYSGVFLSYGLNIRGDKTGENVGETVCEGYSKAYTMLLKAAGIESYVVAASPNSGSEGHAWNVVKISGKYYECDVTWDASTYWKKQETTHITHEPYGTLYLYFLISKEEMKKRHSSQYQPEVIWIFGNGKHPYYNFDEAAGKKALSKCTNTFTDSKMVGIKDNDWNFDGKVNDADKIVYSYLCLASGTTYIGTECTMYFLYNLLVTWKNQNLSPASWCESVRIALGL